MTTDRELYKGFIIEYSVITSKHYCWSLYSELNNIGATEDYHRESLKSYIDTLEFKTRATGLQRPDYSALKIDGGAEYVRDVSCYAIYTSRGYLKTTGQRITVYWGVNRDGVLVDGKQPTALESEILSYDDLHRLYGAEDTLKYDADHYLGVFIG